MARKAVKKVEAPVETPKPKKAKAPAQEVVLVPPNARAIQADVGITALRMVAQAVANEDQINQLRSQNMELIGTGTGSSRGRAQVILAMGIYQSALADDSIRAQLPDTYQPRAKSQHLYKRLRMAIGLAGSNGAETDEAKSYQYKSDTDDEATIRRKESIRTNFQTMLKKATQVALHALDNGIKLDVDKSTGLLRLTDGRKGDTVKKHFGEASVLLNEDQNVKILDKKGQIIGTKQLKVKPSFTEVTREAGTKYGKVVAPRVDSRTQTIGTGNANEYIIKACKALVPVIEKLADELPKEVREAMDSLYNALEEKLA